ncbi:CsbD family protein [Umezawaea endophytica]|uniref:CsbD family protein n=1 Tax=Umezawaea endophytica TaxID=1654476 RepID=A0A9X3AEK4_9PSEU|nr:CsbD family protein [Umezawaea endophytica]MCS7477392.1 CsbD family protein [Umezawaea endophytica]
MSLGDRIGNKAEELGGKAKEAAGEVTGDEALKAEGQGDQASAGLKNVVEDVKDAVGDGIEKIKNVFSK